MADLVDPQTIEQIVGVPRHETAHYGRAVSAEQRVYVLHSQECVDSMPDLRVCEYSLALDRGIEHSLPWSSWRRLLDRPVLLHIFHAGWLVPDLVEHRGDLDAPGDCPATPWPSIAAAERIAARAELFVRMHEWNTREYGPGASKCLRRRAPRVSIEPLELAVGERVKFYADRRWWDVRAVDREYAVLTRSGDFGRGPLYTVIAWAEGRRGPHGGWGHGAETDEQIALTLAALVSGEIVMSERHSIRLDIEAIRAGVSRG